MTLLETISAALQPHGLIVLGSFAPKPDDGVSTLTEGKLPASAVLIGNAGSLLWPAFSAVAEFQDGEAHPLDRWSRRVLSGIATEFGAETIFPFEGPPYWPFLKWLARSAPVSASPLGPYVHQTYGPWFALRGCLLLRDGLPATSATDGPCPACTDKPCLDACPAEALTRKTTYDPQRCKSWLAENKTSPCMTHGCGVRRACPVGQGYQLKPQQAALHMKAFMG